MKLLINSEFVTYCLIIFFCLCQFTNGKYLICHFVVLVQYLPQSYFQTFQCHNSSLFIIIVNKYLLAYYKLVSVDNWLVLMLRVQGYSVLCHRYSYFSIEFSEINPISNEVIMCVTFPYSLNTWTLVVK